MTSLMTGCIPNGTVIPYIVHCSQVVHYIMNREPFETQPEIFFSSMWRDSQRTHCLPSLWGWNHYQNTTHNWLLQSLCCHCKDDLLWDCLLLCVKCAWDSSSDVSSKRLRLNVALLTCMSLRRTTSKWQWRELVSRLFLYLTWTL